MGDIYQMISVDTLLNISFGGFLIAALLLFLALIFGLLANFRSGLSLILGRRYQHDLQAFRRQIQQENEERDARLMVSKITMSKNVETQTTTELPSDSPSPVQNAYAPTTDLSS